MRKLFTVMFSLTLMLIGLTCAAKDFIPGQTYYITGRQVFVRLEPNTGGETYGYWRFGTPVTYVRSENGFALVSRPNENTTLYVYADYLGDVSEMKAKKKPYTDWVLRLDRHFDRLEAWRNQLEQNTQTRDSLAEAIQEEERLLARERREMANSNLPPDVLEEFNKFSLAITDLAEVLRNWDNSYSDQTWIDRCSCMDPLFMKLDQLYR